VSEKEREERAPASEERIAELEAEVSRLKGELASGASSDAKRPAGPASPDENLAPSRTKMVLVAIGIAIVALAGFALVFSALSSGFDSLARKAATSFVPDEPGGGSAAPKREEPKKAEPESPRVPGL